MYSMDNERPDMLLARDRDFEKIQENYWAKFHEEIPKAEYAATKEYSEKFSEVIQNMILSGHLRKLMQKESLFWDIEPSEIESFITIQAITPKGWDYPLTDSDNINILINEDGFEVEITIELFDPFLTENEDCVEDDEG